MSNEVTRELIACRQGDPQARDRLFELVYERLRRISSGQLGSRGGRVTLDTTELVHEAYLKLIDVARVDWQDRNHFFAVAARAMRQVVIDEVRRRSADKRGGDQDPVELRDSAALVPETPLDLIQLDDAVQELSRLSPRLGQLVELRFFGGMSVDETASVLSVSERTVRRDWLKAKAVLLTLMTGGQVEPDTSEGRSSR